MTEGVGKDDVAALINKLGSGVIARVILGDVLFDKNLVVFKAESLLSVLYSKDEVVVVCGVFVVKADKTELEF